MNHEELGLQSHFSKKNYMYVTQFNNSQLGVYSCIMHI